MSCNDKMCWRLPPILYLCLRCMFALPLIDATSFSCALLDCFSHTLIGHMLAPETPPQHSCLCRYRTITVVICIASDRPPIDTLPPPPTTCLPAGPPTSVNGTNASVNPCSTLLTGKGTGIIIMKRGGVGWGAYWGHEKRGG